MTYQDKAPMVLGETLFPFEYGEITVESSKGTPYKKRVPIRMPRLPDGLLKSVFFLYPSEDSAKKGTAVGGTGFLVGLRLNDHEFAAYAVTNWHVAIRDRCGFVRLNCHDGGFDVFEIEPHDWVFDPNLGDVCLAPIEVCNDKHDYSFCSIGEDLLDEKCLEAGDVGVGENVVMLGRFIDESGTEINAPTARFGNISAMPVMVKNPIGTKTPSYLLDLHSRTGYSGSPVFVYRTVGNTFNIRGALVMPEDHFIFLLGIHWGQFPEDWSISDQDSNSIKVKGLSGMTVATPALSIGKLLNTDRLVKERDLKKEASSSLPVAESKTTESNQGDDVLKTMLSTPPKASG